MGPIAAQEAALYDEIWSLPEYSHRSPGRDLVPFCRDMLADVGRQLSPLDAVILDAGCGAGQGALAWRELGYHVRLIDLVDVRVPEAKSLPFAELSLWSPQLRSAVGYLSAGRADLVYCCDVFEHVPPEMTGLVMARLLELGRVLFAHIAFEPDAFGVFVGKSLHQSVYPFTWWRDRFAEVGTVLQARDLCGTGAFLVTP
jgi:2-polyprenyl-3-methyl-5-hydroxy-6-metoxy-1,4-benzoquinol methylase